MPLLPSECPNCGRLHQGADFNGKDRGPVQRALKDYAVAADWYRRCLEDVIDRRPVRGLAEARGHFDQASDAISEYLR